MIHLIDSNVLLDIATDDPKWGAWSADTLERIANRYSLAINPIIYAEVSVGFERIEDLDEAIPATTFSRLELPYDAGFLAGKAFLIYRRRGGKKTTPLPDFYIGAHAAIAGLPLVTRDGARYKTYFPKLKVICP